MKKLKILHIVEALGGGVYSYFIDLSNTLGSKEDLDVTFIYSDKRPEIDPKKVESDLNKNITLLRIPMEKRISPIRDLHSTFSLARMIYKINPDIIHLHSSKMSVIGRMAYRFSFSKAKLFYTPHGYAFLRKNISNKKSKIYYLVEKVFAKIGGITIACGDTEYEYAKKFGKTELIRNGINIQSIKKYKLEKKTPSLTIGILGRITYARNPSFFNEIAEKNKDINFLWIGDGELRNEISASNIEVTGWFLSREDGLKKLNEVDIYIQTSLWEGLPIAVLEAMVFEKPVIATNIIGNKDVVEHEKTGYLFNTHDEFDKYLSFLKQKKLRQTMGLNGYNRVVEMFDCNKNFNDLVSLYKNYYSNKR